MFNLVYQIKGKFAKTLRGKCTQTSQKMVTKTQTITPKGIQCT